MAIPKELEGLLEGFSQEELGLFDNLMTKQFTTAKARDKDAPTLREGWLRQQDYDKQSNEWKKSVDKAEKLAQARQDWFDENKPIHDAALESSRTLEAEKQQWLEQQTELQRKLSEAETRRAAEGGDTVDAAELERRVQEQAQKAGWMSKSEMQVLISEEAGKLAREEAGKLVKSEIEGARKQLWEESFPAIAAHAADIAEIAYEHRDEFKKTLDRTEFANFLAENKISDFKKGYEQFVKPVREKRDFETKVEAEVKQRISGMTVNGSLPVPGGPQPKGALQMRLEKEQQAPTAHTPSAAAAAAAAEMRAEGLY